MTEVVRRETILEDLAQVATRFEVVAEATESTATAEFLARIALLIRDLLAEHDTVQISDVESYPLCQTCITTSEYPCPSLIALIAAVLPARLSSEPEEPVLSEAVQAIVGSLPEAEPDG